ncbi:MAG: D-amino-acid transaminase [Alphaproteobacteria bacterium]|nr:D-amino-acid transaminase [Alphaproteobacteria bacterium]
MSRIAYVNGRYVPHRDAVVHVEDRGYQFADGVYEVSAVRDGVVIDMEPHLDRLERSLRELSISPPMSRAALAVVIREVVRRNRVRDGLFYLQITRGVARRDHAFPAAARPSVVVTARSVDPARAEAMARQGVGVITVPDIRWERCDIKSVSLLPNVLAKQQARAAGAYEAWLVDEAGRVTEGSSTNAWIVDRDGALVTRSIDNAILSGITRAAVMELARLQQIRVVERSFTLDEAKSAREAFITSTTSYVLPVVSVDGVKIGNGQPGEVARRLRELYAGYMAGQQDRRQAGR